MTDILVYGVDGMNPEVVQELGEEQLPTIHSLQNQEDTVYGEFESYVADGYNIPHTGLAWPSIYTGLDEEGHGISEGGWRQGDSRFHEQYTIWDKLSDKGHKLGLYGMPMTYKAVEINGWMVSGFVHTTLKPLYDNALYPSDLVDNDFIENTAAYTAKVKLEEGCHPNMPEEPEESYEILKVSEDNRLEKFRELVEEKGKPEIVAYGTTFADKIGHCASIDAEKEITQKTYQDVDKKLSELIDILDPEEVIIVSDHGFSEWSHDLYGYYLNTAGFEMESIFDFTPKVLDYLGYEYKEEEYGLSDKMDGDDLDEEEKKDIRGQLADLGYIEEE